MDESTRGKSFIRRIADSLTSIVPISIFSSPQRDEFEVPSVPSPIQAPFSESQVLRHHSNWSGFATFPIQQNTSASVPDRQLPRSFSGHTVDLDAIDDNDSNHSRDSNHSVSTSGVSSLLPHESTKSKRIKLYTTNSNHFVETSFNPIQIDDESTLIDNSNKRFNILESEPNSKRMCSRSILDLPNNDLKSHSMFYQGNTSYGGASASSSRISLKDSAPLRYEIMPKRPVFSNETTSSVILSSTARRILENMEKMSSLTKCAPLPPQRSASSSSQQSISSWRSYRYPPYMSAFQRFKRLQKEQRQLHTNEQNKTAETVTLKTSSNLISIDPSSSNPSQIIPVSSLGKSVANVVALVSESFPLPQKPTSMSNVPIPKPSLLKSEQISEFTFALPHTFSPFRKYPSKKDIGVSFAFSNPEKVDRCSLKMLAKPHESVIYSSIISAPAQVTKLNTSITDIFKPTNTSDKLANTELAPEEVWRCINCLIEMPNSKSHCTKCLLPRKLTTLAAKSYQNSEPQFEEKQWSCEVCLVHNKPSASVCACCQAKRHNLENNSTMNVTQISETQTDLKWTCDTCLVVNKDSDTCVCCMANKPSSKLISNSIPKISSTDAEWKCETCLVSNKFSDSKCVCCETPKPGSEQRSGNTNTNSNLKLPFSSNSNATSVFKFGSCDSTVTQPTTSVNFGFVGSSIDEKKNEDSTFKLVTKVSEPSSTSTALFTFGASSTPAKFNFGTNTHPKFEFGQSKSEISNSAAKEPETKKTTVMFDFGQSIPTVPSTNFQFAQSKPEIKSNTGFTFGSNKSNETAGFNFGQTLPVVNTNVFNFGSSTEQSSTGSNAFSFGQSATFSAGSTSNVFSAGSTPSIENRVVKKAVRRLRKP